MERANYGFTLIELLIALVLLGAVLAYSHSCFLESRNAGHRERMEVMHKLLQEEPTKPEEGTESIEIATQKTDLEECSN